EILPDYASETFATAEAAERFFAEEVTETPESTTEILPDYASETFDTRETAERLFAEEVTETPESTTEVLPDYASERFATAEAAERFFDTFARPDTSPPAEPETVAAPEIVAEAVAETATMADTATESVTETVTAEIVTEATAETVAETTAPEVVAETTATTEAVAEAPTETVADTAAAETVADTTAPESVADVTTPATRVRHEKPPTFWRRLFGRGKSRKDVKEAEQDTEPRSVSLEEVVGNTVDAVKADAVLEGRGARRSLFSRRRLEDTEDELPEPVHPEIVGPEPDLKTAAEEARREYVKRVEGLLPALVPALLPLLVLILETIGMRFPFLTGNMILRPLLLFGCLCAALWLCRSVFTDTRCTGTFLCGVSAVAAALDCLTMPFLHGRSMAEPYGAVACLALLAAKLGSSLESHGTYDTFHTAGLDRNPPYLVTNTVRGTCKQRGAVTGFYTSTLAQNFSTRWQTISLPVTLAASLVFAALSSIGQERGGDFLLNWSAILAAGATLVLPFCWGLPWARLAARLKKSGCAIAGWRGAEQMSRKKKMIVTDGDLFPPGAVRLEDVRLYEEEMQTVVSIAASMIRASGCGLERVFDDLLKSEGGEYLSIRDFHFYEDGGFSGDIGEDKILLGTSSFLRKMSVRFPGDFYFPMGLYLSVNGELAATFALKYEAMENVDFALRSMRRNHVTAILAARDPNLTPKLLQRVFRRKIDVEYPGLNNRIALSASRPNQELPRGLLFREGLPPYAEIMVGSLRLCGGVRRSTRLALFGSIVGTLLAFYLVYQAKYYLLSPLNLLLFLILWTVPTVLLMDLS
ncbi:MAG: hypothetical protein IJT31_05330, partial [Oscillibacter sp.]|nr:hypothetical protein [Oscillibacter sp.]